RMPSTCVSVRTRRGRRPGLPTTDGAVFLSTSACSAGQSHGLPARPQCIRCVPPSRNSCEQTSVLTRLDRVTGPSALPRESGRLADTPARDYSHKLQLFNALAAPEIRAAIASLSLKPGMRVLDAGCGTGEALRWLAEPVAPDGVVVGMDLA